MRRFLIKLYNKLYPHLRKQRFQRAYRFRVMSPDKTIEYIQKTHCSIARYGDGEFGLISGTNNPDFQSPNRCLVDRLSEVALSDDTRVLLCIPRSFCKVSHLTSDAKQFWEWWKWDEGNLEIAAKTLRLNNKTCRKFGDASITRPYMDWADKKSAVRRFLKLKTLWEARDLLIVEGEYSRLGYGNDLFANSKSIERIIAPAKNAFNKYDEIYSAVLDHSDGKLVLLALGPTATVLAHDLALKNIQALDIGHIDIEYEWFRQGVDHKTAVPGKECQELHENFINKASVDEIYLSQIILRISAQEGRDAYS